MSAFTFFFLGLLAAMFVTYQEITRPDLTASSGYTNKGEASMEGVIPLAIILFFSWPLTLPLVQVIRFARKKRKQIKDWQ